MHHGWRSKPASPYCPFSTWPRVSIRAKFVPKNHEQYTQCSTFIEVQFDLANLAASNIECIQILLYSQVECFMNLNCLTGKTWMKNVRLFGTKTPSYHPTSSLMSQKEKKCAVKVDAQSTTRKKLKRVSSSSPTYVALIQRKTYVTYWINISLHIESVLLRRTSSKLKDLKLDSRKSLAQRYWVSWTLIRSTVSKGKKRYIITFSNGRT